MLFIQKSPALVQETEETHRYLVVAKLKGHTGNVYVVRLTRAGDLLGSGGKDKTQF